jgi:peptide/nickel transport system permease protein
MTKFLIRRIFQAIPTFFGITLLSYMIMVAAPGDPVSILSFNLREQSGNANMNETEKQALEHRLGVGDPFYLQYIRWLIGDDWMWFDTDGDGEMDTHGESYGILRGDFGKSFKFRENPLKLIGERLPATIELNLMVIAVVLSIGVPLGILAAIYRSGWFDNSTRVVAVIGDAVPSFWMGFMLLLVFAFSLHLLPTGGRCAPVRGGCPPLYARVEYIILPTFVLALGGIAGWSRFMRASMLETINSDYVRTARAKGLTNRRVWFKHAARNALIPMATFLGPTLVSFLGGAVIVETIFSWPGIGLFLISSLTSQDYPVIMASVVIGAVLTIIGYLISDVLYAVFDPRIRF